MSIDYRLTLAGHTPVGDIARRALPDEQEHVVQKPRTLSAYLQDTYGFVLDVSSVTGRGFDAEGDDGVQAWEPPAYVAVMFSPDREADTQWFVRNMLTVVGRLLDTGPEDAALIQNGHWLLLRRDDGRLTKHNREIWWNYYPGADDQLPG
jgi:hypothetical protein